MLTYEETHPGRDEGKTFPAWSLLRTIGNSGPARLTILIPLVGYLILLNTWVVDKLDLSERIVGTSSGSVNRLIMIYLGLVAFAIGSTIFTWRCPLEVKKYASAEEYIAGEEALLSERAQGIIEDRLKNGDSRAKETLGAYQEADQERPTPTLEEHRHRAKQFFRIEMGLYYEMQNRSRSNSRWLASLFYLFGTVLLLYPSALVFCRVMTVFVRDFG
jgi:hypothetical protein